MITKEDLEEIRKVVREELERARGIEDPGSYSPWPRPKYDNLFDSILENASKTHIPLKDQRKPI